MLLESADREEQDGAFRDPVLELRPRDVLSERYEIAFCVSFAALGHRLISFTVVADACASQSAMIGTMRLGGRCRKITSPSAKILFGNPCTRSSPPGHCTT